MCMWVCTHAHRRWERMATRASRRLSLGGEASSRSKRRPAQTLPLAPFSHLTSPQTNLFTPYSHLPHNSLWSDFCSHNFPETIFTKGLVLSAFYSMDTFRAFPCQTFCHIQVCYLVFSLKFWPPGHKDISTCGSSSGCCSLSPTPWAPSVTQSAMLCPLLCLPEMMSLGVSHSTNSGRAHAKVTTHPKTCSSSSTTQARNLVASPRPLPYILWLKVHWFYLPRRSDVFFF